MTLEKYNQQLCEERHEINSKEHGAMWKRIEGFASKIDKIYLLLVGNLLGVIVTLGLIIGK